MRLPDKVYDALKWLALIVLPAFGSAYMGLAAVVGLPYGDMVAEVCVIVGTFIGTVISVSSYSYRHSRGGGDAGPGDETDAGVAR
jgi:hypothetical protein